MNMKIREIMEIKRLIELGYYEGTIFPCEIVYKGGMYKGLPHGKGILILPDGKVYEYTFNEGILPNGSQLRVYNDNCSFYEGTLLDELPHGQGILRGSDGSIIHEGSWFNGCIYETNAKIVWLFIDIVWMYASRCGEVRKIKIESPSRSQGLNWPGFMSNIPFEDYTLYPAIYFDTPSKNIKYHDMLTFPHLAQLGRCPSDNLFSASDFFDCQAMRDAKFKELKNYFLFDSPTSAIQFSGFQSLEEYLQKVFRPDMGINDAMIWLCKGIELIPNDVIKSLVSSVMPNDAIKTLVSSIIPPQYSDSAINSVKKTGIEWAKKQVGKLKSNLLGEKSKVDTAVADLAKIICEEHEHMCNLARAL